MKDPESNLSNVTTRYPQRFRVKDIAAETVVETDDGYHDEFTNDMRDYVGQVMEFEPNGDYFEWWCDDDHGFNWHVTWLEDVLP